MRPDVAVVLPAHNEELLLESTVRELANAMRERDLAFEIVVVENGSADATIKILEGLARDVPEVVSLSLPYGDYGLALKEGFLAARAAIVFNFDVDYYDVEFVDVALTLLEDSSIDGVVASKRLHETDDQRSALRRLLTFGLTAILTRGFGMTVSDAHGMKALRRDAILPFVEESSIGGSLFDVEMILRAGRAGVRFAEVPTVVIERRAPRSSVAGRIGEVACGLCKLAFTLGKSPASARGDRPAAATPLAADDCGARGSARSGMTATIVAKDRDHG